MLAVPGLDMPYIHTIIIIIVIIIINHYENHMDNSYLDAVLHLFIINGLSVHRIFIHVPS